MKGKVAELVPASAAAHTQAGTHYKGELPSVGTTGSPAFQAGLLLSASLSN